jgi:excinuclease ABC subunit C
MVTAPDNVAQKLLHLPDGPGVYLWKGTNGEVLYVGKAKRLKSRVRSYFASDHQFSLKTQHLVRHIADLETIVVPTEAHALILEANLIKEYHPKFNIALRDDKSYPYIKVTVNEPYPRMYVTRRVLNDGAKYFGPYTDVGAMRRSLNVVKRIFTVRSCNYDMPREMPERPCLDFFIQRCKAPCVFRQTQPEYAAMIDEVILFLEGRSGEVVRRVRERMDLAASSLDFERAAELRDVLLHLEQMEEPTVVLRVEGGDRDVVGYARDGDDAVVALLRIREGKLLAREHRFMQNVDGEEDGDVLGLYLASTYVAMPERASELVLPFDFPDRELIEQSLAGERVHVPQRGVRRELVELAEQNARHLLEELKLASAESEVRAGEPVYELARELSLHKLPRTMVCFDISTTQGTDTVGSAVFFENGRPKRGEYRKFKVKSVVGTDDFASMNEVVTRYFNRRKADEKPVPDLIVVDGGKGQLSAAHAALDSIGLGDQPLISLAKRDEEIFVWGRSEPIRLSRRSAALRLLQRIRDEAHRFAVTFNRKRRSMRTVTSELLSIPGVGPVKRRQLIQTFGSVQGVRDASLDDIAAVAGFTKSSAQRLKDQLAASDATSAATSDSTSDSASASEATSDATALPAVE